ncbi:MAG: hydroxymethylbilane synthase [Solirubrobacteraceae bacterium]|nr:hydroxymethylbilane synthase [Solirubrobacteraceae bacterium]
MKLGTRGSALALAQAQTVADALGDAELVVVTTSGDRDREASDDKERWTRELDAALLEGRIDAAVHSAKDLPATLAPGIVIAATPPRADASDALCGADSIEGLPAGARVGTSSLRRTAQLAALRDDIETVELHGNVDTRLQRLADGDYDAIVLASAGLERLGRSGEIGGRLEGMVPAAGQGTLAITTRAGEEELVAALDDAATHAALEAERAVVIALDADCHTPVGAHAGQQDGLFSVEAFVGRPDGSAWVRDRLAETGANPAELGARVADRLVAAGALEVLGRE